MELERINGTFREGERSRMRHARLALLRYLLSETHRKARYLAWRFAQRAGIVKPPCVCGNPKVQMHHPNYYKPLEVAFLCVRCHKRHHQRRLTRPFVVYNLRDLAREQGWIEP